MSININTAYFIEIRKILVLLFALVKMLLPLITFLLGRTMKQKKHIDS